MCWGCRYRGRERSWGNNSHRFTLPTAVTKHGIQEFKFFCFFATITSGPPVLARTQDQWTSILNPWWSFAQLSILQIWRQRYLPTHLLLMEAQELKESKVRLLPNSAYAPLLDSWMLDHVLGWICWFPYLTHHPQLSSFLRPAPGPALPEARPAGSKRVEMTRGTH